MAKKAKSPLPGRWRITWMDQWDQDFVDEETEGYFEFGPNDSGSFQFGYVQGTIDYRTGIRDSKPCVEFTWDGNDECSPAGYKGRSGELWYVRRLPPLMPELATFHVLFTTPYILIESTKDDWMQFLKRTLLKADGNDDRERLHQLLKFGLSTNDWNEFVFQAYHHHQAQDIFLAGIPDLKATLPHA